MPTLNFLLYLLAIGLAWLFRLVYLGWLGPYLLAAVIFTPVVLLLLSLPAMLSSRITLRIPYGCRRGDKAAARLEYQIPLLLPLGQLRVCLEVENLFTGERERRELLLKNLLSGARVFPLPTACCGTLRCRLVKNERRDILGLVRLRQRRADSFFCTVFPEAIKPEAAPDLESALQSYARLKPKLGGGYSEEHEHREYRPGDTMNSIHWKLSAKTDKTIVREPLVREDQEIFLVLSQVGVNDRGLEVLHWLSQTLCELELPHTVVADKLYAVDNEQAVQDMLREVLSAPLGPPCAYDAAHARCVFQILAGEVSVS